MGPLSETVTNLINTWSGVILLGIGLLVAVSAIQTYLRTKSWVPVLGVVLVGALAMWGVANVDVLQDSIEQEINTGGGGPGSVNRPGG
jgi:hypothetical protein